MILITGGNGALAKGVAKALRAGGVEPLIGTRTPAGPAERMVDFDAPETLADAFGGVDTLLLVSAGYAEDDVVFARHRNAIEAAAEAGVAHVVYTSLIGAGDHLSIAAAHRYTERLLAGSRLDATVLRNGLYAELFAADARSAVETGALALAWGAGGLRPVAREDLAEAAANVLRDIDAGHGGDHRGRTYELDGTEYIDGELLADALASAAGREIAYRDQPLEAARQSLTELGLLPYQVGHAVSIMSNIKAGFLDRESTDLPRLLDRAPRSPLAALA